MKIILNDGTELNVIVVNGGNRFYQNAQRNYLEFVFRKGDYAFDMLDDYFADKIKTRKIIILDQEGGQYVYDDYVLRVSMELRAEIIEPETSESPAITEDRIFVTMAQQTYLEKLIEQLLGQ